MKARPSRKHLCHSLHVHIFPPCPSLLFIQAPCASSTPFHVKYAASSQYLQCSSPGRTPPSSSGCASTSSRLCTAVRTSRWYRYSNSNSDFNLWFSVRSSESAWRDCAAFSSVRWRFCRGIRLPVSQWSGSRLRSRIVPGLQQCSKPSTYSRRWRSNPTWSSLVKVASLPPSKKLT